MRVLLRKLFSLFRLLATPEQLRTRAKLNFAMARSALTGGRPFIYRNDFGIPQACLPEDESSLHHYVHGEGDAVEMKVARAWLKPGDFCIDVGANVGLFAASFCHLTGSGGRVMALEPSPITFARLVKAADALGLKNLIPLPVAASDHAGLVTFYTPETADVSAEEAGLNVPEERRRLFRRIVVPTVTLDEALRATADESHCVLLKSDAEGADPLVLRGAQGMIQGDHPPLVIVEVHPEKLGHLGFSVGALIGMFPDSRFHRFLVPHSLRGMRSQNLKCGEAYRVAEVQEWPFYGNLVAVPKVGRHAMRVPSLGGILPIAGIQGSSDGNVS